MDAFHCPNYSFNASTNQITNTGFTFDAAGNLTADGTGTGTHTYQWDAEGRLKSIDNGSTATYTYNALGHRVEKNVAGVYTEYSYHPAGKTVAEHNRSSFSTQVIPFKGRHLAHYQNGATYFNHSNNLGTTSHVTDHTGTVAQDQLYYPWGQEQSMVGTSQEKRFAALGHRDETETGLDPTHSRMLSSTQGRWLSPDPVASTIMKPADPQSLNRYAYVRNSPLSRIDPGGTNDCEEHADCEDIGLGTGEFGQPGQDIMGAQTLGPGNLESTTDSGTQLPTDTGAVQADSGSPSSSDDNIQSETTCTTTSCTNTTTVNVTASPDDPSNPGDNTGGPTIAIQFPRNISPGADPTGNAMKQNTRPLPKTTQPKLTPNKTPFKGPEGEKPFKEWDWWQKVVYVAAQAAKILQSTRGDWAFVITDNPCGMTPSLSPNGKNGCI